MNNSFDLSSVPLTCDSSGLDSSDNGIPQTPLKKFQFESEADNEKAENSGSVQCKSEPDFYIDFDDQETVDNSEIIDNIGLGKSQEMSSTSNPIASGSHGEGSGEKDKVSSTSALTENVENGTEGKNESGEKRTFFVLDELPPSDEDGEDGEDEFDSNYDESEVDDLLEKGYNESQPRKRQKLDNNCKDDAVTDKTNPEDFVCRHKTVLVEKNPNHFEVLPDGWITVSHSSGMPVYLHRATRVCTFSKPYFLGGGSCRNHRIPASAIPCFHYRRALEAEKEQPSDLVVNGTTLPQARVVTAQENDETSQMTAEELKEYCSKLFQFKDIEILRFTSWPARRKFHKKRRNEQRPSLPEGSKLITCPIRQSGDQLANRGPTEWIMNPNGKTYVCILHDYVQRALKERPVYTFKELENTATPYLVTISINGVEYGKGLGSSKKQAKMEAARLTLEILIPGMKKIAEDPKMTGRAGDNKQDTELSFFDDIKIEDPRVVEFCTKTTEPLPHAILLTCLQRNFGLSEMNITYDMKAVKHSKNEYTITVGNHTATVDCQSKRDGKQKASQALLQILHPHIQCWGSLLRLYGNSSVKSFKEKKVEEQEITALQSKGNSRGPNYAILNKLKAEMLKLKVNKKPVEPIGIFVPPEDVKMPTSSTSDLNNLAL